MDDDWGSPILENPNMKVSDVILQMRSRMLNKGRGVAHNIPDDDERRRLHISGSNGFVRWRCSLMFTWGDGV